MEAELASGSDTFNGALLARVGDKRSGVKKNSSVLEGPPTHKSTRTLAASTGSVGRTLTLVTQRKRVIYTRSAVRARSTQALQFFTARHTMHYVIIRKQHMKTRIENIKYKH